MQEPRTYAEARAILARYFAAVKELTNEPEACGLIQLFASLKPVPLEKPYTEGCYWELAPEKFDSWLERAIKHAPDNFADGFIGSPCPTALAEQMKEAAGASAVLMLMREAFSRAAKHIDEFYRVAESAWCLAYDAEEDKDATEAAPVAVGAPAGSAVLASAPLATVKAKKKLAKAKRTRQRERVEDPPFRMNEPPADLVKEVAHAE